MVWLIVLPILMIGAFFLFMYLSNSQHREEDDSELIGKSFKELEKVIKDGIYSSMSSAVVDTGLDMEDTAAIIRERTAQRTNIQNACSGDPGARRATKMIVRKAMGDALDKNKKSIDHYIVFDVNGDVKPRTAFETLLYVLSDHYELKHEAKESWELVANKTNGFDKMIRRFEKEYSGFNDIITSDMILNLYEKINPQLSNDDKCAIAEQIIFSDLFGLKIIDSLNYQTDGVEELQIGVNGLAKKLYDSEEEVRGIAKNVRCAKDSIYVLYHGRLIWLDFLRFENDAELKGCINNLIVNCNSGELTEKTPKIVTYTDDGRRISVARPPVSDAFVAYVRKFNNTSNVELEDLYPGENNKLLVGALTNVARTCCNICLSGEMGSGKTTTTRAIARKTANFPIGTIEMESFELNARQYFPDRNVIALRVYEEQDEESVMAFARKTTRPLWIVGEITSPKMANLSIDLSQMSKQVIITCHNSTTLDLINTFKNGKLTHGGFTNVMMAQKEAIAALRFDIQVINKRGDRYIGYIHEIVPITPKDNESDSFYIASILEYDPDTRTYIPVCRPSHAAYEKAKLNLSEEEYNAFTQYFDTYFADKPYADEAAENPTILMTAEDVVNQFRDASWYFPKNEDDDFDE